MQTKQVHILVDGRVQGVTYRASTRSKAKELGLNGWVQNLADGRVEAVAQGDADDIESLIEWAHQGPPMARVESVEVQERAPDDTFEGFEIRR